MKPIATKTPGPSGQRSSRSQRHAVAVEQQRRELRQRLLRMILQNEAVRKAGKR